MGLFSRKQAATLTVPAGPFRPTESVTVVVDLGEALDGVTAAEVELGYVNGYRYRWAGRENAALSQANDALSMMGQVGTNAGSDKNTDDWVHVLSEPLVVAGEVLGAGQHQVAVRLPSWSPGSSKEIVRWQVRLKVERDGRDVKLEEPLTVVVPAPDPLPEQPPVVHEHRALTCRDTPKRTALVAGWLRKEQASHPLEKNPGATTEEFVRPMRTFFKDIQFHAGERVEYPFAIPLPADLDPTTEAVHSSLTWAVQIKVEFSGATGGIERAERQIVVHTG